MRIHFNKTFWLLLFAFCVACLPKPEIFQDSQGRRGIRLDEEKQIGGMSFSANGDLFLISSGASGHDDNHATRVLDARSLKLLWQTKATYLADFDPDAQHMALFGFESVKTVDIRDARSGRPKAKFTLPQDTYFYSFVGHNRLAAFRDSGFIDLFDTTRGKLIASWPQRRSRGGITAQNNPGRNGIRLTMTRVKTIPEKRCGTHVHVDVVDYPSGIVRCQIASLGAYGKLPTHSSITATSAGWWSTLLVDTDSCRALALMQETWAAQSDGLEWLVVDRAQDSQYFAKTFNPLTSKWTRGPRVPADNVRNMVVGPTQIAVSYSELKQPYGQYVVFRPYKQKNGHRKRTPIGPQNTFFWEGTRDQRVPLSGATKIANDWLSLRLLPMHKGIALELGNRSTKPIEIDWSRTTITAPDQKLCLEHIGCDACNGVCKPPCVATEIAPGATWIDVLTFRKPGDSDSDLIDPFSKCGQATTLKLGLKSPSGDPAMQEVSLSLPCDRKAIPTKPNL